MRLLNFRFFYNGGFDSGLLGVASQNNLVYISYTNQEINGLYTLVVDEYSMNFTKVRNIIKIGGLDRTLLGGNLLFDSHGSLYLSVGVGVMYDEGLAQNLNSLRGKNYPT